MDEILKKYKGLFMFIFVYGLICFLALISYFSLLYPMLVWNVCLATLPLLFINASVMEDKLNKGLGSRGYFVLWLLFFPNAIYMITDFIHISNDQLIWIEEFSRYSSETMYSQDIMLWVKLLIIGVGVFYALLIGLESLRIAYKLLIGKTSKGVARLLMIGISIMSGFGIYIGRFLRFNSWDVLRPVALVKEIFANLNGFALNTTLAFAVFIMSIFILYMTLFDGLIKNAKEE